MKTTTTGVRRWPPVALAGSGGDVVEDDGGDAE
jgi:hypothetical protein